MLLIYNKINKTKYQLQSATKDNGDCFILAPSHWGPIC